MTDTATVTTTTATSSAQGTPNAQSDAVKTPAATPTPAEAAPSKPATSPEAKAETKDTSKPASEPAKAESKTEAKAAEEKKVETPKETVYEIKLPEDSKVPKENVETIKAYAKAQGLTNEAANQIATFVDANQRAVREMVDKEWLESAKNNPVYGKEKFPESCENIKRFLGKFPAAQALLDQSGYAHHPDIFPMLAELAAQGKSDSLVSGKQAVTEDRRTVAQKIADDFNKSMGVTK